MLPFLALAALQARGILPNSLVYDSLLGPGMVMIQTPEERMRLAKLSPKTFGDPPKAWQFEWQVGCFVRFDPTANFVARFDVFSQESTQSTTRPLSVARELGQLLAFNAARLKLDHSQELNSGIIDVYLCYGGKAGGEQLYDVEHQSAGDVKVNTIYIYDLPSFTNPVEMAREVAHEYGHAVLPAVGGYSAPESWSNGLLGEKLYLSYLAQARRKGELTGADTMGATADGLEAWVKANVDPLVADAALNGPRPALLARKDRPSMDAYLGLALLTARLYGPHAAIRALGANGFVDATTFPAAAAVAAEEPERTVLDLPASLRTRPIWIPLGKATLTGATTLERKDGWVRIKMGSGPVVVRGIAR